MIASPEEMLLAGGIMDDDGITSEELSELIDTDESQSWLKTLTGIVTETTSKPSKAKGTQQDTPDSAELMKRYGIKSETHRGRRVLILPYNVDPEGKRLVYEAIARESA
jgi:hypothetical protein